MKKVLIGLMGVIACESLFILPTKAAGYKEVGQYGRPTYLVYDSPEQIEEEIVLGDMELMAQLVEAEAGNQDFEGKCLVVDVLINRLESEDFPNTVEEVIFQENQFSVTTNGAWEKAAWNMKEDDYKAVEYELAMHTNKEVLYFNNSKNVAGSGKPFKHGGHWFNK